MQHDRESYRYRVDEILLSAARLGRENVVAHLIAQGVDMASPHFKYCSKPPHTAAKYGHVGVITLMLAQDAHRVLQHVDSDLETPLFVAARYGQLDIARALYAGCDEAVMRVQRLPLCELDPARVQFRVERLTALHYAAIWGQEAMVVFFLAQGIPVDVRGDDGTEKTPLHRAAENCMTVVLWSGRDPVAVIRVLLEAGADAARANREGITALHFACTRGVYLTSIENKVARFEVTESIRALARETHKMVIKLLLDHGADLESRDKTGRTPLHYAAERGEGYMIRNLLSLGANINATTLCGETPLRLAINETSIKRPGTPVKDLGLLEAGPDVTIKDDKGLTVLDVVEAAVRLGKEEEQLYMLLLGPGAGTYTPRREPGARVCAPQRSLEVPIYIPWEELKARICAPRPGFMARLLGRVEKMAGAYLIAVHPEPASVMPSRPKPVYMTVRLTGYHSKGQGN